MATLLFVEGTGLIATIVRLMTRSSITHVAIRIGDMAYQASKHGVRRVHFSVWSRRYKQHKSVSFTELPDELLESRLIPQLGCKYNFRVILDLLLLRSSGHVDGKWHCSELIAYVIREFVHKSYYNTTPSDIYLISKAIQK